MTDSFLGETDGAGLSSLVSSGKFQMRQLISKVPVLLHQQTRYAIFRLVRG